MEIVRFGFEKLFLRKFSGWEKGQILIRSVDYNKGFCGSSLLSTTAEPGGWGSIPGGPPAEPPAAGIGDGGCGVNFANISGMLSPRAFLITTNKNVNSIKSSRFI